MPPLVTPERIVAPAALAQLESVLQRHGVGQQLLLVCDEATWAAAGNAVTQRLESRYTLTRLSLGAAPHATVAHATHVAARATHVDALIAIGAGTINDITKYAAFLAKKPYVCVATAASMNGYGSANASLLSADFKQSFAAAPPRAIIADIDILVTAPPRLARAGLADTLCRSTVETDMLLSHILRGTDYPRPIFDRLRAHEPALMRDAALLNCADAAYHTRLMHALLDAGDAMNAYGSSAVASQGEHMIAHTLELLYGEKISHLTHGEVIAITTITMQQLQHAWINHPQPLALVVRDACALKSVFGVALGPKFAEQHAEKALGVAALNHAHAVIHAPNTPWAKAFDEVVLPPHVLTDVFTRAGIDYAPERLGISAAQYSHAVSMAHATRDRFTFLDLQAMAEAPR